MTKFKGKNLKIVKGDTVISSTVSPPLTPKDKAIMAAIDAAILEFRTSGEAMKVVNDD